MALPESSDSLDHQVSGYGPEAADTENCIVPHHKRSPIIWDQGKATYEPFITARVSTIRRAQEMGCETCSLLCEAMAAEKSIPITQLTGVRFPLPDQEDASETVDLSKFYAIEGNFERIILKLFFTSEFPCHPDRIDECRFGKHHLLPARTDSEDTFAQVQEWLKECTSTHSMCDFGADAELPTRLLDLSDGGSAGIVKLTEVKDAPMKTGKYACLSHCWGGEIIENAVTTKQSLNRKKQGISVESLPQTFQDAIKVTRKLAIRYLWIDSMCILQDNDDQSDWDQESRKMASIYKNALITIAATCSGNSNDGFIHSSDRACPHPLKYRTATGQPVDFYVSRKLLHHEYSFEGSFHPLLKRAWAYQERLLSPRYLHFTFGEVVWECGELIACQCSKDVCYQYQGTVTGGEYKRRYTKAMKSGDITELQKCWKSVLGDYSYQVLSFEKDRLRAIAGIVNQLSAVERECDPGKSVMGRYIEGLWEDTLCEDLCWSVSPQHDHYEARRSDWREWKAPTWSWAAVQDPFCSISGGHLGNLNAVKWAKIVEVGHVDHPQACQEQVQYNCIRLELPTYEMTLVKTEDRSPLRINDKFRDFGRWDLEANGKRLETFSSPIYPDYDYTLPGADQITAGSTVICGLLIKTTFERVTFSMGLLLMPVDAENRLYKRIGCFDIKSSILSALDSSIKKKIVISLI
ncbi:HET-domain-containing protein [Jackrogersella minutella]|nr:HET-domain-containing protein [Jackrogersella minutella]